MDVAELQAIADTLMRVVTPDMKPKQLVKVARKEHPGASKKDVARAAVFSIIAHADEDHGKANNLQASALAERTQQSDGTSKAEVPNTKGEAKAEALTEEIGDKVQIEEITPKPPKKH